MAITPHLAMTATEIAQDGDLYPHIAWMTPCDRESWRNLPGKLQVGTLLAVTDEIPIDGQDASLLCDNLSRVVFRMGCKGVFLDFQRPGSKAALSFADMLANTLPCPVAVSDLYAKSLSCPVFLSPLPLHKRLADHLSPWTGREVWLDISGEGERIAVTKQGSSFSPIPHFTPTQQGFPEQKLHCHYTLSLNDTAAEFLLWRTEEDLQALLEEAEKLGIKKAIGLYQELFFLSGSSGT